MLSDTRQTQKDRHFATPLSGGPRRTQTRGRREQTVVRGPGAGWGVLPGDRGAVRGDRKFWRQGWWRLHNSGSVLSE